MKTKLKNLPLPAIHSNGSGARALRTQSREVYRALQIVLDKMRQSRPHGRDYYTLGDDALKEAQEAHASLEERVEAIADVYMDFGIDIARREKGEI